MSANNTPKTAREAQQQKEMRRASALYAVIAVLFVLLAVAVGVWKSNIIQKNADAAAVYYSATAAAADGSSSAAVTDNVKVADVTAPQFGYYFTNIYQNFLSSNSSYLSYLGLDSSVSLRSQTYPSDESMTWFDYFEDQALTQMATVFGLSDTAAREGYAWNDAMQAELDASLTTINTNAEKAGLSLDKYLQRIYGSLMTESVYTTELKRVILANDYAQNFSDNLTYTDAEVSAAYSADPNSYDVVDYESVRINGAAPSSTDASGAAVEPTDGEKAAAMDAAKAAADKMLSAFRSGRSLSELAEADENAYHTDREAAAYTGSVVTEWLFDDARRAGDTAVLADESGESYYVVSFERRYRQDENTINVRHILIQPEAGTLSSGDEGYDAEQAQLKADARARAEALLDQWKSGAATEDSFAELARQNSTDGGSATNGGLYEQVYPGQMVQTFNDWCFDPSRTTGDTDIVETDYGFHIMYFVSTDLPYWQAKVESDLRNSDFNAWYASAAAGYSAESSSGMKYVG